MEKDTLAWLQEWYRSKCDGEWEHEKGIRIDTLDNPGWSVVADIGTVAEFSAISEHRGEYDWLRCEVKEGRFYGHGEPGNLGEILEVLRTRIRRA
jgi:hypothetical protein